MPSPTHRWCILSSTFFPLIKPVLEPVKLGGFILKNSRILEVSASSCRAPLCYPAWLVTTCLSILIASLNSALVTSPCGCTLVALGNSYSSTLRQVGRYLTSLHGGIII
ncbi:hypothetical protein H5410_041813 [Solanum commersonii]|uniref:Uncharacterized protein n=1 Tax=Solanum commersonii TaxID=4109 RepID=A0A9J5XSL8_SOLCO|nr:hypothetical protein H5410_041813 [Solanum commersonii]